MKLNLRQQITRFAQVLQSTLFPILEEELGELSVSARHLVATLEMIPLARFVPSGRGWMGRPSKDRYAIACAFVAKAVYGFRNHATTVGGSGKRWATAAHLWLGASAASTARVDFFTRLRRVRAYGTAAVRALGLIAETQKDRLIGHIARDSTAITAREHFPEIPAQRAARKAERKAAPRSHHTPAR